MAADHGASAETGNETGTGPRSEATARAAVERALREAGLEWETPTGPGEVARTQYVVTLPGVRKLATTVSLVVGRHTLSVNAFVVRRPDENHAAFYRWLLERNTRLPGVAYAVDRLGDVYLTGRLPLGAVTPDEVDRLLGAVLEGADGAFNTLLELAGVTRRVHPQPRRLRPPDRRPAHRRALEHRPLGFWAWQKLRTS
jgi:hypothetical protein